MHLTQKSKLTTVIHQQLANSISLLRIILAPLLCYLIYNNITGASWLMLCLALSDGIDGYVARNIGQETALGKLLDPIADKVIAAFALLAIAIRSGSLTLYLCTALQLCRDLFFTHARISAYLKSAPQPAYPVTLVSKFKTILLFLARFLSILGLEKQNLLVQNIANMLLCSSTIVSMYTLIRVKYPHQVYK